MQLHRLCKPKDRQNIVKTVPQEVLYLTFDFLAPTPLFDNFQKETLAMLRYTSSYHGPSSASRCSARTRSTFLSAPFNAHHWTPQATSNVPRSALCRSSNGHHCALFMTRAAHCGTTPRSGLLAAARHSEPGTQKTTREPAGKMHSTAHPLPKEADKCRARVVRWLLSPLRLHHERPLELDRSMYRLPAGIGRPIGIGLVAIPLGDWFRSGVIYKEAGVIEVFLGNPFGKDFGFVNLNPKVLNQH
ncbi:DNA-directed RNA polymerase subunit beta'' [Striga asiatica]|uniref:DNA-directed RNA polymerase subunit beta n=1 Tax=Striga asiatica TaxID=4170 RepID=A0A5A7PMV3_STRAF|nr:DNA-directed RNA polymerase subunit beta'' [Striga asiatica]